MQYGLGNIYMFLLKYGYNVINVCETERGYYVTVSKPGDQWAFLLPYRTTKPEAGLTWIPFDGCEGK